MPFWFIKLCFAYRIEFNSWQYNVLKLFALNDFTIIPKMAIHLNRKMMNILCLKQASNILQFNLSIIYY